MSELVIKVLAALGALGITGAVAAGASYWLFKTLAKAWLDSRFQKDLEKFRAANAREVERLKADLGRYADRATKFHVREYEVLPEAWGMMNKAFGAAEYAVSALQHLPDLDRMTQPHLEAWLEASDLKNFQKDEIRGTSSKTAKYTDFFNWKQIGMAEQAIVDFQNYVVLQGVFIDEELATKMIEAARTMRRAMISRSMVEQVKGQSSPGQTDFWAKSIETLEPVREEVQAVKAVIRARLSDIRLP
jgi:hypothetical protein